MHSEHTPDKLKDYTHFLDMHIRVTDVIVQKTIAKGADPVRCHIELNGGPGWYPHEDPVACEGTPVIAARQLWLHKIRYSGAICEHDAATAAALARRLERYPHTFQLYPIDYRAAWPTILQQCLPRRWRYGLLVSDEDGASIPFDLLREANTRCPQVDILIHATATGLKRARGVNPERYMPLDVGLRSIGKKFWQVRTYAGTAWQWCFLFGTNWAGHPRRDAHYHWTHMPEGAALLEQLSKTQQERRVGLPAVATREEPHASHIHSR